MSLLRSGIVVCDILPANADHFDQVSFGSVMISLRKVLWVIVRLRRFFIIL